MWTCVFFWRGGSGGSTGLLGGGPKWGARCAERVPEWLKMARVLTEFGGFIRPRSSWFGDPEAGGKLFKANYVPGPTGVGWFMDTLYIPLYNL